MEPKVKQNNLDNGRSAPIAALSNIELVKYNSYTSQMYEHIKLPLEETRKLVEDFRNACEVMLKSGVTLDEAISRMPPERLGGFYARPANNSWFALDYAARVYPLSMKRGQMSMFRLSCYLKQPVRPELLQVALTYTITRFPSFATTVKNGFFWHYLNVTKRRFEITEETHPPFRPIDVSSVGSQSFRVLYYGNRISCEYFHVLTDGTGGIVFLKTLVSEYLRLCATNIPCENGILDIADFTKAYETSNDFENIHVEASEKNKGLVESPGVPLGGVLSKQRPCRIIHFNFDTEELKTVVKSKNVSMTVYLLTVMFVANKYASNAQQGDIKIQVPVNIRKFYNSKTLRNFSMFIMISVPIEEIGSPSELIPRIQEQLKLRTSKQEIEKLIYSTVDMTNKLRYVPLLLKRLAAKIVYRFADSMFSNTLSNLGVINCPDAMTDKVQKFDFVLLPDGKSRASCGMISFGGTSVFTVTKMTSDPSFEEKMLKLFENDGLNIHLEGSSIYGY